MDFDDISLIGIYHWMLFHSLSHFIAFRFFSSSTSFQRLSLHSMFLVYVCARVSFNLNCYPIWAYSACVLHTAQFHRYQRSLCLFHIVVSLNGWMHSGFGVLFASNWWFSPCLIIYFANKNIIGHYFVESKGHFLTFFTWPIANLFRRDFLTKCNISIPRKTVIVILRLNFCEFNWNRTSKGKSDVCMNEPQFFASNLQIISSIEILKNEINVVVMKMAHRKYEKAKIDHSKISLCLMASPAKRDWPKILTSNTLWLGYARENQRNKLKHRGNIDSISKVQTSSAGCIVRTEDAAPA